MVVLVDTSLKELLFTAVFLDYVLEIFLFWLTIVLLPTTAFELDGIVAFFPVDDVGDFLLGGDIFSYKALHMIGKASSESQRT